MITSGLESQTVRRYMADVVLKLRRCEGCGRCAGKRSYELVHRLDRDTSGILLMRKNCRRCVLSRKQLREKIKKKIHGGCAVIVIRTVKSVQEKHRY